MPKVRFTLHYGYEFFPGSPKRSFEEIFSNFTNLATEELELYWIHDEEAIKFINLFPNCKKLSLILLREMSAPFEIGFPHLQNLQEVSLSLFIRSTNYDFNNIRVGSKLLKVKFICSMPMYLTTESMLKLTKNNPNIQSLTFIESINHESLQVVTSELRNLKSLVVQSSSADFLLQQNDVDLICDCQSLEDIAVDYVRKEFKNQIVKRFHTDVGRSKYDMVITDILYSSECCNIKICENAVFSKRVFEYHTSYQLS